MLPREVFCVQPRRNDDVTTEEAVREACRKLVKVEKQRAAELAPVLAIVDVPDEELDFEEALLAVQNIGMITHSATERQRRSLRDAFQPLIEEVMDNAPPELLEALGRDLGDEDTTPSGNPEIPGIDLGFVQEPERPEGGELGEL